MRQPKKPQLSEHIRQCTQEWLRKAEHELAYLAVAPLDIDHLPTNPPVALSTLPQNILSTPT